MPAIVRSLTPAQIHARAPRYRRDTNTVSSIVSRACGATWKPRRLAAPGWSAKVYRAEGAMTTSTKIPIGTVLATVAMVIQRPPA